MLESGAPSMVDEKHGGELRSSNISAETTQASDGKEQAADAVSVEYPTGLKLVSIILALVLGIFLASLDMVSSRDTRPRTPNNTPLLLTLLGLAPDYCCDGHPQDHR
jgi:hypothetical protein